MDTLPSFPVDEITLAGIEHALTAHVDASDPDNPRAIGAEFGLPTLLAFLSGTCNEPAGGLEQVAHGTEFDRRPQYAVNDVIRALIVEVRRLRDAQGDRIRLTPPATA